jgi:hypothetical protein
VKQFFHCIQSVTAFFLSYAERQNFEFFEGAEKSHTFHVSYLLHAIEIVGSFGCNQSKPPGKSVTGRVGGERGGGYLEAVKAGSGGEHQYLSRLSHLYRVIPACMNSFPSKITWQWRGSDDH